MARRLLLLLCLAFIFAADDPGTTYFRDHAGDRVKWERWEKPAFDRAQKEEKPIALVVGSFAPHSTREAHAAIESQPATVAILNTDFVPVLLDRVERPEIAAAYAAAGGRADSSDVVIYVLTPDLEWLANASAAELPSIAARWKLNRNEYLDESRLKVRRLRMDLTASSPVRAAPDLELLMHTDRDLAAAKLRELDRSPLHDLLGGAFFRASRDVDHPFFDIHLDDQARWALLFLEASQTFHDQHFAAVAQDAFGFALREMRMPNGAFSDSQQADSLVPIGAGPVYVDGGWYLWDRSEILQTFGPVIGSSIVARFGVPANGKDILRPVRTSEPETGVAVAIAKMLEIRTKRPMPRRDEPVLESSGQMISALARAGALFNDEHLIKAADVAASVIQKKKGPLSRRPSVAATPGDVAALVTADIDLYEATLEKRWLDAAIDLQSLQDASFWNEKANRYEGGRDVPEPVRDFILTSGQVAPLNRVSAENLVRLATISGRDELARRAEAIATTFSTDAIIQRTHDGALTRVVIFGAAYHKDTVALMRAAQSGFDRMRVIVHGGDAKHPPPANVRVGSLQPNPDGTASAYVCRASGCSDVFTDNEALAAALH